MSRRLPQSFRAWSRLPWLFTKVPQGSLVGPRGHSPGCFKQKYIHIQFYDLYINFNIDKHVKLNEIVIDTEGRFKEKRFGSHGHSLTFVLQTS